MSPAGVALDCSWLFVTLGGREGQQKKETQHPRLETKQKLPPDNAVFPSPAGRPQADSVRARLFLWTLPLHSTCYACRCSKWFQKDAELRDDGLDGENIGLLGIAAGHVDVILNAHIRTQLTHRSFERLQQTVSPAHTPLKVRGESPLAPRGPPRASFDVARRFTNLKLYRVVVSPTQ